MKPVDVNILLSIISTAMTRLATEKCQTIEQNLAVDLPEVLGSEGELQQCFVNIIQNAIEYTPAEGTVIVESIHEKDNIIVKVRDNGIWNSRGKSAAYFRTLLSSE